MTLSVLLGGCGDQAARPASTQAVPATAPAPEPSPWRFGPTLDQHLPSDAVAEPLLELSMPRRAQVLILAAVWRPTTKQVELERWTFGQIPDQEELSLVEGGQPLVRLRPGPRGAELTEIRRRIAAPGAVLTRPIGLSVPGPAEALAALTAAAARLDAPGTEPRERVEALATLFRGLDDPVIFNRDSIATVVDLLGTRPQTSPPQQLSSRRARVTLTTPSGPGVLELQRKSGGWVLASIKPPPPPTPGPGTEGDSSGTGDAPR